MMVTHRNWAKQKKQEECCVTTLKTAAKETTGSGKATQPNFRNLKFCAAVILPILTLSIRWVYGHHHWQNKRYRHVSKLDKAGLTCIGALTQKNKARTDTSQNYLSVKHTSRSVSVSHLVQSQDLPRFKEIFRPQNSLLMYEMAHDLQAVN